ncbi:MAG: hypothetical protein ACKPKO_56355 [Candidatus Fonsibacter sp.]
MHDLIQDQLYETKKKLRVKDNVGLSPNKENVIPILTHYFQSIENIAQILRSRSMLSGQYCWQLCRLFAVHKNKKSRSLKLSICSWYVSS